jgi:hypothetical protein
MKKKIIEILEQLHKLTLPDNVAYSALLQKIDFNIDKDFLEFIQTYNGVVGNIGENNYIHLWNAEEITKSNPYYEDSNDCKNIFFFGSDGASLGYAFDKKSGQIVSINFYDIDEIQPDAIAGSFESFLNKLSSDLL